MPLTGVWVILGLFEFKKKSYWWGGGGYLKGKRSGLLDLASDLKFYKVTPSKKLLKLLDHIWDGQNWFAQNQNEGTILRQFETEMSKIINFKFPSGSRKKN